MKNVKKKSKKKMLAFIEKNFDVVFVTISYVTPITTSTGRGVGAQHRLTIPWLDLTRITR